MQTGLVVTGYTGVLPAIAPVPLWSERPANLGRLFVSSAMSSGLAAIAAATELSGQQDEHAESLVHHLETLVTVWLISLGTIGKPLHQGQMGYVVRHAVGGVGMATLLLISAVSERLPKSGRRAAKLLASALTLAGVFAIRYAVAVGGRQSAKVPQAIFEMTGYAIGLGQLVR